MPIVGQIDVDPTKIYLDFFIESGRPRLVQINLISLLQALDAGEIKCDDNFKDYLIYLERWTREAPRKRFYRGLKKQGITVFSTECWFEEDDGEQIIDNLENTGKIAKELLDKLFPGQWTEYKVQVRYP